MVLDTGTYLERIGFRGNATPSLETLTALQRAHLRTVPFENLHVFHRLGVRTDVDWSVDKIVAQRRGGWCFELNGAFAALLEALGFTVVRLGAAVLLDGPNAVIDHLTIEVQLDEPYLVDVGFGDSFTQPLALNRAGEQDGGTNPFELLASPLGTTLARLDDGIPVALYRFKRVRHRLRDFEPISDQLQSDPMLHWSQKPFATRSIDGGSDRVWLLADRLKVRRGGEITEEPIAPEIWESTLREWFDMGMPG